MVSEERFLYYITVCNEGNLTKAAEKLYISQPALTKYINSLEKELGIKLMDRTCQPIELTGAGILYLDYAKDSIEKYQKFKQSIAMLKDKSDNNIVFGISSNLSKFYLPKVLEIALKINPDFEFKIIEDTSFHMENLIINGEVDMAFLNTENMNHKDVDYKIIKEDRICLVCKKSNSFLQNKEINEKNEFIFSKEEMEDIAFYFRDEEFQLTKVVNNYLNKMNIRLKNYTHVTDLNTILYLLCNSDRFAFVPEYFLNDSEYKSKLSVCNIENEHIKWYMTLACSKKSSFNKYVKEWISSVEKFYKLENIIKKGP